MLVVKAYLPDFPLDENQITNLITLLAAFILGTAIEDAGKRPSNPGGAG